ncbi:MAG: LysM peptidoglycan-binding domain-containing protein [Planctomycetaceae bacterium]|nr:LysM peptidoglycan-binding domain-containing protein [Planctomycetaceae bacterium]
MNKQATCIVIAVIGLGAGVGAGFLINRPKLNAGKAALAELQAKMQQTEQQLQAAGADSARLNSELRRVNTELTRYKTEYVRASTDLARVTVELNKLKESIIPQAEVPDSAASAVPAVATSTSTQPAAVGQTASAPKASIVAAGEYVIKDGDNLWNIASEQLGSGIRFKEILALNPGITEKTTLAVGSKIKLPAK